MILYVKMLKCNLHNHLYVSICIFWLRSMKEFPLSLPYVARNFLSCNFPIKPPWFQALCLEMGHNEWPVGAVDFGLPQETKRQSHLCIPVMFPPKPKRSSKVFPRYFRHRPGWRFLPTSNFLSHSDGFCIIDNNHEPTIEYPAKNQFEAITKTHTGIIVNGW